MKRRGLAWLLAVLLLAGCVQKPTTEPPTAEPTETPPVETQDETPPEVENNGGSYVRVGDTVYFRRNGARQSDKTAVYGDFTSLWSDGGESELMAYDTASGALTALCTEPGAGALGYGVVRAGRLGGRVSLPRRAAGRDGGRAARRVALRREYGLQHGLHLLPRQDRRRLVGVRGLSDDRRSDRRRAVPRRHGLQL